ERGDLKHLLFFDEAKRLFSLGIPLVGQLVSVAREFGQGLILADQMPSCLDHATLANVYTTITLNLAAPRDINAISFAMGLNTEQKQALNSLPLRTAIVKLAGRYSKPFQIYIPDLVVNKNITDTELASYMQDKLADLVPANPPPVRPTEPEQEKPDRESSIKISENEYKILWDIKNHPYIPATGRLNSLNMTTYMGQRVYSELLQKGLVKEHEIKMNYRGRPQKFYELADKGIELVGQQNLGLGKGGFVHRFHQHRLKTVFENQGYKVKIEEYRNGKNADLGLTDKSGKTIAVEIAMSPQGEISNIEKDIAVGWNEVWTLCDSEEIFKAVKEELKKLSLSRINSQILIYHLSEKIFF
ncbi:MAG: hypothetical protein PHV82_16980, partial [Victivallaceae bacterium]|nr:hypothetical protein [Victivallaceae bacterium]